MCPGGCVPDNSDNSRKLPATRPFSLYLALNSGHQPRLCFSAWGFYFWSLLSVWATPRSTCASAIRTQCGKTGPPSQEPMSPSRVSIRGRCDRATHVFSHVLPLRQSCPGLIPWGAGVTSAQPRPSLHSSHPCPDPWLESLRTLRQCVCRTVHVCQDDRMRRRQNEPVPRGSLAATCLGRSSQGGQGRLLTALPVPEAAPCAEPQTPRLSPGPAFALLGWLCAPFMILLPSSEYALRLTGTTSGWCVLLQKCSPSLSWRSSGRERP